MNNTTLLGSEARSRVRQLLPLRGYGITELLDGGSVQGTIMSANLEAGVAIVHWQESGDGALRTVDFVPADWDCEVSGQQITFRRIGVTRPAQNPPPSSAQRYTLSPP